MAYDPNNFSPEARKENKFVAPVPPNTFKKAPQTGPLGATFQDIAKLANLSNMDLDAQLALIAAQSQAATAGIGAAQADIGLAREKAQFDYDTTVRDVRQGIEQGVEDVTSNSLQRGIYASGIRKEGQQTVKREGKEALGDARKNFDFTMRGLANRAAGLREQISAAQAMRQAQIAQATSANQFEYEQALQNIALQYGFDVNHMLRMWEQSRMPAPDRTATGGSPGAYGAGR